MKIAIDSWVLASRFRYHGTYIYARNLIAEFRKIAASRPEIKFCLFTSPSNSNDAALFEKGEGFEVVEAPLLSHDRLWRLGGAGRAARRTGADVVFTPTVSTLAGGSIPLVCTIHDVTPLTMPSHSRKVTMLQRSMLWFAAKFARTILTDSECSKKDLIKFYGVPESRVSVVYLGYDKTVFNDSAAVPELREKLLSRLGVARPYILHHGVIQPRKNLKRLIEAYRLMLSRKPDLQLDLVLAGGWGWDYDEIVAAAKRTDTPGRVIITGPLDAPDLAHLIKGARLAVMPSLYEGFCLPMVEAMACGAPVVAANASCLPEISGGVLKYFDPYSVEEMAACMRQALEDEQLRNTLMREGKKRAAFFDWSRCAEETLKAVIST